MTDKSAIYGCKLDDVLAPTDARTSDQMMVGLDRVLREALGGKPCPCFELELMSKHHNRLVQLQGEYQRNKSLLVC